MTSEDIKHQLNNNNNYKVDRCVLTEHILLVIIIIIITVDFVTHELVSLQGKRLVLFAVVENSRLPLNCLVQMSSAYLIDCSTSLSAMLGAAFPF